MKESIAKLDDSVKSMILTHSCQNWHTGLFGCGDTRRSSGPSQCKAGEPLGEPGAEGQPHRGKVRQKGDFTRPRSVAIGSDCCFFEFQKRAELLNLSRLKARDSCFNATPLKD